MRGSHLFSLFCQEDRNISEYGDVYDSWTTKPSNEISYYYNKMVKALVNLGSWATCDLFQFYSTHTNDDGEAQKNWIQPAGGTHYDGTIDPSKWASFGSNTSELDGDDLKITYVDDTNGARTFLKASSIGTDLVVGKTYKLRFRAKVNIGTVQGYVNGPNIGAFITATDFTWHEIIFTATSTTGNDFRTRSMGGGEIVWIDQWYVQVWTGAVLVETPLWEQYKGFTPVVAPRAYVKCSYTPSLNAINYALNSATVIVGTEAFETDAAEFGSNDGSSHETRINSYNDPGGGVRVSVNCLTGTLVAGVLGGIGHAGGTRNNATQISIWQNISSQVVAQNSTQLPEREFYAGTSNTGVGPEYMNKQIRYVWISSALTSEEYIATINAIETCLSSLGSGLIT